MVRESNMNEIKRLERELYECALAVEQDEQLNAEMAEWDVTVGDGLERISQTLKQVLALSFNLPGNSNSFQFRNVYSSQ